ncbi:UNVERIFIED_CONTAM: putative membrane protein YhfC [Acetivibrio alkalicellulosi]
MISYASFIAMIISLLMCFLFPVFLYIVLRKNSRNITGAVVAGAIAFYISQMIIRLPLIQAVLPNLTWFSKLQEIPLLLILFMALSAALFEETARFLAFTLLLKERQVWKCGIAFGIGHGGIEAILLVGMTYVNNIVLSVMINTGNFHSFLQDKLDNEAIEQIYVALMETPFQTFLAAGIERTMVILIHIALSVMILEGIVRKQKLMFYFLAVIFHSGINYVSSYLYYKKVNIWLVELFIALVAALAILNVIKSKKRFGSKIEYVDEAKKAIEDGY